MDQRFELVLTPKKSPTDARQFAQRVLSDLAGLVVVGAEKLGQESVVVTAELRGIAARHSPDQLHNMISIVTDRAGVELSVVHLSPPPPRPR
jgi:hypothetical protein